MNFAFRKRCNRCPTLKKESEELDEGLLIVEESPYENTNSGTTSINSYNNNNDIYGYEMPNVKSNSNVTNYSKDQG